VFKLISKEGDFLPIMYRIKQEGNKVLIYIDKEKSRKMYDGILQKVTSGIELDIQPDDVVLFDMVGAGKEADVLKDKGYLVIGAGKLNDKIELDREAGQLLFETAGIRTPKTFPFKSFEGLEEFVRKRPARYVFKPNGNLETDLTYIFNSSDELISMIPYLESRCPEDTSFDLQEFIDGIEMSTEGWFNGEKFIQPLNSTMEEKRLFAGGVGPNTGCMGNVVWVWQDEQSEILYRLLFEKLEEPLRDGRYLGPLDINAIWTPDGPYAIEFTARFGYDAIQAFTRLWDEPIGEVLESLPSMTSFPASPGKYAMAIRVSVPPYPYEKEVPEVPILGVSKGMSQRVYLSDVYYDGKILRCAGADGYILAVADHGSSLSTISSRAYSTIEGMQIPGKQYRIDVGERVAGDKAAIGRILDNLA
jgi:phosphoribosylamine--glycine ligase